MAVVGICVSPSSKAGKTAASVVVVTGTVSEPVLQDAFLIKSSAVDDAEKVVDIARGVASKLSGASLTDVVLRTADFHSGRGAAGGALGSHCEGALVAVLRERIDHPVLLRRGLDVAKRLGLAKQEAELLGGKLAPQHAKAATAALSGLPK